MVIDQHDYMGGKQKKRQVTEVLSNSTNIYSTKLNSFIIGSPDGFTPISTSFSL